jgi:hypothetical protein
MSDWMTTVTIWCIGVSLVRSLFCRAMNLSQLPFCPMLWGTWTALAVCFPRMTSSWLASSWVKSPAYFGSQRWPRIELTGSIRHSLWVWLGYMEQTGCSTHARVEEYHWHICFYHLGSEPWWDTASTWDIISGSRTSVFSPTGPWIISWGRQLRWSPTIQHEQGRWLLLKQVMEASQLLPEGT